ncbi:hypothetical protein GGI20_002449 [Coemansia sp. BCRC 34301]|nr:hypothetical protein GGI20_002449 [Coemansia sp. BCRC 34301]
MGLFSSCFGEIDAEHSRRGARRVTKAMIGTPSNFVHTGHLGIGTVQGGDFTIASDPEKLKTLMSQVSAALDETDVFGESEGTTNTASSSPSPSAKSSSMAMGMAC